MNGVRIIADIKAILPTLIIKASPTLSAIKPVDILPMVMPQKKRDAKEAALDSLKPPETIYVAFHTIMVFSKEQ